eukprot:GILI01002447.1.p1 GENE.GILI01002447.1~~GILI01002447.1.p1  ORF type:complete len:498 (+),score=167.97 GILI01002447.1:127-1620(+)
MGRFALFVLLLSQVVLYAHSHAVWQSKNSYLRARQQLLEKERVARMDVDIVMSPAEQEASEVLHSLVSQVKSSFGGNPTSFNFFSVKAAMESSQLFAALRQMPKAGLLHTHSTALADVRWVIKELTYEPFVFMDDNQRFFVTDKPTPSMKPVNMLREASADPAAFDDSLYQLLTINGTTSQGESAAIWQFFNHLFDRPRYLINYKDFFPRYITKGLQDLVLDGVTLVELRHVFGLLFELDGTAVSELEEMKMFAALIKDFTQQHPGVSIQIIYCGIRFFAPPVIAQALQSALLLRRLYPSLLVGFDLVGEEDPSHATADYLDELLNMTSSSDDKSKPDLPYFFHGGETLRAENQNLVDMLLLGTRRIGHGIGLIKHPALIEEVKRRDVCMEICPISNQVLGYYKDMRTHPATSFLRDGVCVTVSNDDAALFQYSGVTHDWAWATVAWELDLSMIKKLLLNSLRYSNLSASAKQQALTAFLAKWEQWIGALQSFKNFI